MTIQIEKKHFLIALMVLLLALLGFFAWKHSRTHEQPAKDPLPPATINRSSQLTTAPKTSATDNDVELTQLYRAKVNGQVLEAPIGPSADSPNGTKGIIKQEIDLTPIIEQMAASEREKAKREYQKNWQISTGIGVHEGDWYVPIELQRTYHHSPKVDRAISIEVHQDLPDLLKTTGGEIKHAWKF